jgi:RNA polymerase sigma factor (sigma-70 family)
MSVDTGSGRGGTAEVETRLAALMTAAQDGDHAAYQRLLLACKPFILATARGQGVAPDRIDDVVQEVLLTVHRARRTYDPARPFLPWLRAIAQRRAIDALRLQGRRRAREIHAPLAYESHPDPAAPAEQVLEQSDQASRLRAAVAALPEGQRQAVEELGFRERTLEEAAASTGRTKGALKVNLHRALKTLRVRLAGEEGDNV